jgi:hypothetical protein
LNFVKEETISWNVIEKMSCFHFKKKMAVFWCTDHEGDDCRDTGKQIDEAVVSTYAIGGYGKET